MVEQQELKCDVYSLTLFLGGQNLCKGLEWDRSSQSQHHYAQKSPESNHAPHVHEDISLLELALI